MEQTCLFFLAFLEKEKITDCVDLHISLIEKFILHLKRENRKETSIARYLSSIKNFVKFLEQSKYLTTTVSDKIGSYQVKEYFPEALSQTEIEILLDIKKDNKVKERNFLILHYLYALGLRVSELVHIKINDIDLDEGLVRIFGKGRKMRLLPLAKVTIKHTKDYLKDSRSAFPNSQNTPELFLNKNGKTLSRVGVWKVIKALALEKKISANISPHTFRHSFATHMIQNGADIRTVQELLGHSDIKTTEIYTHLLINDLKAAIQKTHPLY